MERHLAYTSPIGPLLLLSDGEALCRLDFMDDAGSYPKDAGDNILEQSVKWLDDYFSTGHWNPDRPPMRPKGTVFREAVWQELAMLGEGRLTSYGELARKVEARLSHHTAARAVGGAVGANPIAIMIPCHRVVGSDRSLTGFSGGLWRKKALLELEGFDLSTFKD